MAERKTALITGASRGIGKATALALAAENYNLTLFGRDIQALDSVKAEVEKSGCKCETYTGDVTDDNFVKSSVAGVIKKFGKVDVLINNAGYGKFDKFIDSKLEDFKAMMDVNLYGVYRFTKEVVPGMIERKSGTIINISSLAGKNSFVGGTMYSATKHALMGFSRSLMLELREFNIRVAAVCPGSVRTDFFKTAGHPPSSKKILAPEDVADSIMAIIKLPPRALLSELDIRPTNP